MQGFREYDCFVLILKVFVYILDSVNVSKKIVFLVVRSEGGGRIMYAFQKTLKQKCRLFY